MTMQGALTCPWGLVFPSRSWLCRLHFRSSGIACRHITVWWHVRSLAACTMNTSWKSTSHDHNPIVVAAEWEERDGSGKTVHDTSRLANQSHPEGEQAADL